MAEGEAFGSSYARQYDGFNRSKDYAAEVDYLDRLICQFFDRPRSLLDLGCGTGGHAVHFAKKGYSVHGVDRSAEMIAQADQRAASTDKKGGVTYHVGNIQELNLGQRFDVITSLFHVVSYLTSNAELNALMQVVRLHLNRGGVFLFDCWYGPAVLTQHPEVRVKRVGIEGREVTRIAEPILNANANTVDVRYEIIVSGQEGSSCQVFRETHKMRYFFRPEIDLFLSGHGLSCLRCEEWLTGRPPGTDTWGALFVASKRE